MELVRRERYMIIEKILGNLDNYSTDGKKVDTIGLEWYETDKRLLRKAVEGEEIGIRLESGVHLRDGDVLYDDGARLIAVTILPCELTVVSVDSMQAMGHLCFELGNRHLSLSIKEHEVCVPYDAPTYDYLEKLGFAPVKKTEKFTDFTVCHAHGHSAGATHTHVHKTEHRHG